MKKNTFIIFIIAAALGSSGCGSENNSEGLSLRSQLSGKTFQAEGVGEILALVSDCNGGQSLEPSMGGSDTNQIAGDEPAPTTVEAESSEPGIGANDPNQIADNGPESTADEEIEPSMDGNDANQMAVNSGSPADEAIEPIDAGSGGAVSIIPAIRAAMDGDYEATFEATLFILKNNDELVILSGIWEATDGNTIEVETDGETISLDVEVSGDVLTVSLPAGTSLNCTSGGSGESMPANDAEYEDETDTVQ